MTESELYAVWSNARQMWWRSNGCGYTLSLHDAGFYSRDDALAICRDSRDGWPKAGPPPEIPVKAADAYACARSP